MRRLTKALILVVLICLPSLSHATNGLLQIGYGTKSKGMGGVGIALPQDSFAAAMNPAGLVYLGCRADVGLHWHLSHVRSDSTFTDYQELDNNFRLTAKTDENSWWPEVGATWAITCDQTIGLAAYVLGQSRNDWHGSLLFDQIGQPLTRLESDFFVFNVTPAWGWQMNSVHSFGVAANISFARFRLEGLYPIAQPGPSIDPTRATGRGGNWKEGVSLRLGWIGQFSECFQLGLTYQTKTWMGHFNKYRGFFPDRGNADLPGQLGFGVTYYPYCDVILSAEVVKIFWRNGKWFENEFSPFFDPNNGFGSGRGPGLGWNEQLVFKIGGSWDIWECLTLRIGFNYGNTPLSMGNALNPVVPAVVTQHFTLGGTYDLGCGNELTINYVHGRRNDVAGARAPFNGSDINLKLRGWQRSVGVSYGRCF